MTQTATLQKFWCPFIENEELHEENSSLVAEIEQLEENHDISKSRLDYCIHILSIQGESIRYNESLINNSVTSTVQKRELALLDSIIDSLKQVF